MDRKGPSDQETRIEELIDELADRANINAEVRRLASKLEQANEAATEKTLGYIESLKALEESGGEPEQREKAARLRSELTEANKEVTRLQRKLEAAMGISEEEIERLLAPEKPSEVRLHRDELTPDSVEPTESLDDVLPEALSSLIARVDEDWLNDFRAAHERSLPPHSDGTLSLVHGLWPGSNRPEVHRFAQALFLAEDFLANRDDFDFFSGSVLIPQIAALGASLEILDDVSGSQERIRHLWQGPSQEVESTVYELLVAAALARSGFEPEFVEPTPDRKTPDIRLGAERLPAVVECKRQRFIGDYERSEERHARRLFAAASEKRSRDANGVFDVSFNVEITAVEPEEFATSIWNNSETVAWEHEYEWGQARFRPLPEQVRMRRLTRLFSPNYLATVFGWDLNDATHDGYCAEVAPPERCLIDEARDPLGMAWQVNCQRALERRCRSVMSHFGRAAEQVPTGERGIIYFAYQEGHRADVADARTERILGRLREFDHRSTVLIPYVFINRFIPAALDDGAPDTIENCIELYGYEKPGGIEEFPCRVLVARAD